MSALAAVLLFSPRAQVCSPGTYGPWKDPRTGAAFDRLRVLIVLAWEPDGRGWNSCLHDLQQVATSPRARANLLATGRVLDSGLRCASSEESFSQCISAT